MTVLWGTLFVLATVLLTIANWRRQPEPVTNYQTWVYAPQSQNADGSWTYVSVRRVR